MSDSRKWEHAQPLFLSNQAEALWLMESSNLGQYKLGERCNDQANQAEFKTKQYK